MRILVFGGTFNPVHNGHVAMCKAAQQIVAPDFTMIIPTYTPPHKSLGDSLLSGKDRLNMCRLAFDGLSNTKISDIEIAAEEKSYSFITFTKLHSIYPDAEFYMLCGADMFLTLKSWYKYERLINLTAFCAVPRKSNLSDLREYAKEIEADGGKCVIIDMPPIDISSTEIRNIILNNGSADTLLPEKVADYIERNRLFRRNK